MTAFNVEGTKVNCKQLGGSRIWTCTCEYFIQSLNRPGSNEAGYCPHIAVAIMECIENGAFVPSGIPAEG